MVAPILGIKSFYYQVKRGKGWGEKGKTLFMKLPFMGICSFHTVELFPKPSKLWISFGPKQKAKKKEVT